MNRLLLVALVSLTAIPAVAFAAAKPGSYSGTSSAKYIQVGSPTEPTDKGKVTFGVGSNKVRNFRLRGQQMNCGGGPVVPVTVKTIKLNSRGKGSATREQPDVGYLTVKITVTSAGKASGTIRKPSNKPGLCNPDYPVRFTAKRT
ncbi:MAG: hypothetical protein AABM43_13405 [Actinomycetota bacterium]